MDWPDVDSFLGSLSAALFQLLYWIFDVMLSVVEHVVTVIPVPLFWSNLAFDYNSLPVQAVYLMTELKVFYAISIIGAAVTIRFILNLIPAAFTRV